MRSGWPPPYIRPSRTGHFKPGRLIYGWWSRIQSPKPRMRLRDRVTWLFLSRFQKEETRRKLKAQYHQWQFYGYSHIVAGQTLLSRVLFSITQLLPEQLREQANATIHQVFGISPLLYRTYRDRYLQLWNMNIPIFVVISGFDVIEDFIQGRCWQLRCLFDPKLISM